jgi:hypothetical protein
MSDPVNYAEVQPSVQDLINASLSHGHGYDLVVSILRESAELISQRQPGSDALSEEQAVLPGLARLVPAFPADMRPASVNGFMTTPQEHLLVNDQRSTPVEWLLHGGNPQDLVDILDGFLQA